MKAIVHFRTLANGTFKYMAGLRRGYYRVIIVRDENGSTHANSHNVISIPMECSPGILGVTERSRYYLGGDLERCQEYARTWNEANSVTSVVRTETVTSV